jgi:hypothetical protein
MISIIVIEFMKFKKDASNGLSYEKMRHHQDKTHPRQIKVDKKSKIIESDFFQQMILNSKSSKSVRLRPEISAVLRSSGVLS